MQTSLFEFHLPESLIASAPANPRDSARMLVVGECFDNEIVSNFPSHLRPNDIVVFNNTRVIPARLIGKRGEAKVELLLHKRLKPSPLEGEGWQAFAKPAKRLKIGDEIIFADDFSARVVEKQEDGQIIVAFDGDDFMQSLMKHGLMPLPPYIEKKRKMSSPPCAGIQSPTTDRTRFSRPPHEAGVTSCDSASYQTIYAKHEGSVAAPTAGLHFTERLLAALDASGASRAEVTLHVGGGTFLPVKVDDTSEHVMHSEWAEISAETAAKINAAKAKGGRVIAVGTTSLRTLESATNEGGIVQPFSDETNIFITPGYRFKCVDMLLTNFHLPRSTLFMLVSAFAGLERMQAAYAHAIAENYRFYSYGDACLLSYHPCAGRDPVE